MSNSTRVTVITGDGIGPEIMGASLSLADAAGARLDWELAEAGAVAVAKGEKSGVPRETLDSIERTGLVLKGPLATPIGSGAKSANVTLRKMFETFANIRPVRELPGVASPFAGRGIDLVVVRENVEDLYAGIEHMQTPDVAQCLKLVSRLGCQRIARTALELAVSEGRERVTVATKANIMKFTEGMMQREFEQAARNYPQLRTDHMLIDNCAHQLVMAPEQFDIIVTTNMNGDIISDLASGLVGGLGFAPSANLGERVAIFEAVHGTAPDIAGKDLANPTAMILATVMLLHHDGQSPAAERLEQALFAALEEGAATHDMGGTLGTREFAAAIGERIGRTSSTASRPKGQLKLPSLTEADLRSEPGSRGKAGVDVFIESHDTPENIAERLAAATIGTPYQLSMISNRGTVVWPSRGPRPSCVDHYRCRFLIADRRSWHADSVLGLLERVGRDYRWMHVEKLDIVNGEPAFTVAQGE
ncbi:MAG TPA: NADP-dependent isocitrate dehydrogenase [Actinobacteria bacterium]|nr:NADP-dependent isocitrate dehydrogenase [Actinomycetota bacterium]